MRLAMVVIEYLDRSIDQDKEIDAALAARVERRSRRHAFLAAIAGDPLHHLTVQVRIGLRLPYVRRSGIDLDFGILKLGHESKVISDEQFCDGATISSAERTIQNLIEQRLVTNLGQSAPKATEDNLMA